MTKLAVQGTGESVFVETKAANRQSFIRLANGGKLQVLLFFGPPSFNGLPAQTT